MTESWFSLDGPGLGSTSGHCLHSQLPDEMKTRKNAIIIHCKEYDAFSSDAHQSCTMGGRDVNNQMSSKQIEMYEMQIIFSLPICLDGCKMIVVSCLL